MTFECATRVDSFTGVRSLSEHANFGTKWWTIWIRDEFGTDKVNFDRPLAQQEREREREREKVTDIDLKPRIARWFLATAWLSCMAKFWT